MVDVFSTSTNWQAAAAFEHQHIAANPYQLPSQAQAADCRTVSPLLGVAHTASSSFHPATGLQAAGLHAPQLQQHMRQQLDCEKSIRQQLDMILYIMH